MASSGVSSGSVVSLGPAGLAFVLLTFAILLSATIGSAEYSVHDMRVVNTDAKSYWEKSTEKCLEKAEKSKKKMYM